MKRIKRYYLDLRCSGKGLSIDDQISSVIELGATRTRTTCAFGWSNQSEVVCFNATDEVKDAIAQKFNENYLVSYHWRYKTDSDCRNDIL